MSLASLCSDQVATIKRVVVTQDTAMGQVRSYTTAGRGALPVTTTGRLQQMSDFKRIAYKNKDEEVDAVWYSITDPQCDHRDQIILSNGDIYFCQSQKDFDIQHRLYKVELKKYQLGVQ